jgi:nucleoside phosphorylase
MPLSSINLVVALPAEAKPISSRFGLERVQPDLVFPLYRRERVTLVVAGPGKANAAAATAFLYAVGGCPLDAVWVNPGIAGHAEGQIGEILLAHEITDAGSDLSWHPSLAADSPCPSENLVTLDRPDLVYEHDGMVDMEASGFYPTARRFSADGLVQVLKTISDNRQDTARGLTARRVRHLMGETLDTLEALIALLEARAARLRETPQRTAPADSPLQSGTDG